MNLLNGAVYGAAFRRHGKRLRLLECGDCRVLVRDGANAGGIDYMLKGNPLGARSIRDKDWIPPAGKTAARTRRRALTRTLRAGFAATGFHRRFFRRRFFQDARLSDQCFLAHRRLPFVGDLTAELATDFRIRGFLQPAATAPRRNGRTKPTNSELLARRSLISETDQIR
jgi:hypothetical protein